MNFETITTPFFIRTSLLTLATCVQPAGPASIESKPIVATNEHASKDLREGKATTPGVDYHGSKNKEIAKNVVPPKSLKNSSTSETTPPAGTIETFTLSGAKVSIDPESCTVEVDWKGQRFRETLKAVGDPHVRCMVSRRANGEIQEYSAERGTAIVIGSSSKPDKEGWCEVRLHGLLLSKTGPRISMAPQTPKLCGVHDLDELVFALLAYETRPMKMGQ